MRKRTTILAGLAVAAAVAANVLMAAPSGPRSLPEFQPNRVASLETEMWKAYYGKENIRLFRLLVVRAEAAALRDSQAARPDWITIGRMLDDSYASLHEAVRRR